MNDTTIQVRELTVNLPPSAPLVRITAGVGSAGQKTWNLRRPVTLIGSRRPAHIVLHEGDISTAHCVIVNTGTDVLLKDLHTSGGTSCNGARIDLVVLKDGDVIAVGATTIQVAICLPEDASDDSACGLEFQDPTTFPKPLTLGLMHTDKQWDIEDAVVLIGRHRDAPIRIDHPDISSRHAVLFRFKNSPALFDLGSRAGLLVNGQRCSLTSFGDGDCLTVGPFGLSLHASDPPPASLEAPAVTPMVNPNTAPDVPSPYAAASGRAGTDAGGADQVPNVHERFAVAGGPPTLDATVPNHKPASPAEDADRELTALQAGINDTWERLNTAKSQSQQDASTLDQQDTDLAVRKAQLDARDAALRGQLHDVTRFHEELAARERELARQMARTQVEKDALAAAQREFAEKELDVERRTAEINRRQNAIAQRWTRLLAATCPHCGKPINVGRIGPNDAP